MFNYMERVSYTCYASIEIYWICLLVTLLFDSEILSFHSHACFFAFIRVIGIYGRKSSRDVLEI